MANIAEKVQAFLNDEKKVEALGNDKAFMEKVAGGTVTNQDIAKKFSELGLELTPDEAEEVGETAVTILKTAPIAVEGDSLDTVSGGHNALDVAACGAFVAGAVGTVGALGCNIAGAVCKHKGAVAASAGNTALSAKYSKAASDLNTASIISGGIGAAGIGTGLGLGIGSQVYKHKHPPVVAVNMNDGEDDPKDKP